MNQRYSEAKGRMVIQYIYPTPNEEETSLFTHPEKLDDAHQKAPVKDEGRNLNVFTTE